MVDLGLTTRDKFSSCGSSLSKVIILLVLHLLYLGLGRLEFNDLKFLGSWIV